MKTKKLLLVSHLYPPTESVGGLRAFHFSRNLAQLGWHTYVVKLKTRQKINSSKSANLVNNSIELFECADSLYLSRFACRWKLFVPDFDAGWILPAFGLCRQIVKKLRPQVVVATCSPFSSAVIGALIKKEFGIPLLLDFRDPWTFNEETAYPTLLHKYADSFLESNILRLSDHLVVVTKTMRQAYVRKYSFLGEKISTITNGFDFCDFPVNDLPLFEKFTILYCGTFYGQRRPDLFLNGLKEAVIKKNLSPNHLQVLFLGIINEELSQLIESLGLTKFVSQLGYFSHEEAIEFMFRSHLLLLVEPRQALTTKVFEYLATGKPILALFYRGELYELVREHSDVSYLVTSNDSSDVAKAINDCYAKWADNKYQLANPLKVKKFMQEYNRPALTKKLSVILDNLCNAKH
jgi:glycosyltransferase involved in cell wall biosynthesis